MVEKKLLLVIDMQHDFIAGSLGTAEARQIVPRVAEKITAYPGDIIYTLDTHGADYLQTQEGHKLPVPHCHKGQEGWLLHPDIAAACEARRAQGVEKSTFAARDLPPLLEALYPQGLAEIELVGLCTDICVIANALLLKTFFPETPLYVDAACCAGVTPPSHENALRAMQACQINIRD